MKQKRNLSLEKKNFQNKLLRYSSAAGTALALGSSADASIVPIDVTGLSISLSGLSDAGGFTIDLNNDAVDDFSVSGSRTGTVTYIPITYTPYTIFTTYTYNIAGGFYMDTVNNGAIAATSASSFVKSLAPGAGVSAALSANAINMLTFFQTTYGSLTNVGSEFAPPVASATSGFVGLSFDIGGNNHFAWLEVLVSRDADGRPEDLEVLAGAWESQAGVDIQAGAIPEPASVGMGLGLLALGATGVRAMRRRRD
jgi:hypothetical protein